MSHIPVRTCVACRRARPRTELVRVVRTPDDGVTVEERATAPGRGAYVCRDTDCITTAIRDDGRPLRRALRGADVAPAITELRDLYEHLKTTARAS
ncbi:MAG: YlxR family protein [Actinobacteria bacterium]|nr:YlxR family protein [Actinomycetota bacterium]